MMSTRIARGFALLLVSLVPACGVGGGGTLTPTTAPGIPAAVTTRGGNRSVLLTWSSSPAATTYAVKRSSTFGGPYTVVAGGGAVTSLTYTDTGLTNDQTYYYVVTASNNFGESPHSAEVPAVPEFKTTLIAAGNAHSLARLGDGSLWGWGSGGYGQLGNGAFQEVNNIATKVLNLSDPVAVAGGEKFTLALLGDGTVWAWGANDLGQLGNGPGPQVNTPVRITTLSGMTAIAAGSAHALAVKSDGTVWAWGANTAGELGTGAASPFIDVPVQVSGVAGAKAVVAGHMFSLVLLEDETVWAWGANGSGQLGNPAASNPSLAPFQVYNLTGVKKVVAGVAFTMALRKDGAVWTWGANNVGQLGIGSSGGSSSVPVKVASLAGITDIAAGDAHALAVRVDGTVWSWGLQSAGQLGDGVIGGFNGHRNAPFQITLLTGVKAVASAGEHCMALQNDNSLWGWGSTGSGQVGNGTGSVLINPSQITNLTSVAAFWGGNSYSMAARTDQTLWVWGLNNWGVLGLGSPIVHPNVPTKVTTVAGVIGVAGGLEHSAILLNDGTVRTAGHNFSGQLGNSSTTDSTSFVPVSSVTGMSAIAVGERHTLALRSSDKTVWAWGANSAGQLGNGANLAINSTRVQTSISGVVAIAAGAFHSVALKDDKTVWTWGQNDTGCLGVGPVLPNGSNIPVQTVGLTGVVAISCNIGRHVLALKDDGTVWAWGWNSEGQLGNGTQDNASSPSPVPGVTGAVAIGAGEYHSIALLADGTILAWGRNGEGQLGSGTLSKSLVPVPVSGLTGPAEIRAGGRHNLARLANDTLMGWGSNGMGELGIGSSGAVTLPILINQ